MIVPRCQIVDHVEILVEAKKIQAIPTFNLMLMWSRGPTLPFDDEVPGTILGQAPACWKKASHAFKEIAFLSHVPSRTPMRECTRCMWPAPSHFYWLTYVPELVALDVTIKYL